MQIHPAVSQGPGKIVQDSGNPWPSPPWLKLWKEKVPLAYSKRMQQAPLPPVFILHILPPDLLAQKQTIFLLQLSSRNLIYMFAATADCAQG